MKTIIIIFKKELIDTLRDRRTLITMVLIPLLLFPILIGISSRVMRSQIKQAQEKSLKIGLLTGGNAAEFKQMLLSNKSVQVIEGLTVDSARTLIQQDSLDAFIEFTQDFDKNVADLKPGKVTLYYKMTEQSSIEKQRVMSFLNEFEQQLRATRFKKLDLDESIVKTIDIQERNLASAKEQIADVIGGFLPYLFIIFCFLGSMYPAVDLAAGEKERGTLETLLTSPAGRMQILLGKFGVVVLTGILTAVIAMVGLYLGIVQTKEIPPELFKTIIGILELRSVLLLLSLLLPLTIFFAAVLLSLSIIAKSYKEAQSIISPMMIVIILPAFLGLMPGMNLDAITALIPILNVSLATKAIIAGKIAPAMLAETYFSLVLFAGLSLYACAKIFGHEGTIFRGS